VVLKEINWSFYTVEEQCEIANNFKSNKENGITYEISLLEDTTPLKGASTRSFY
jgi:hypothetical protein